MAPVGHPIMHTGSTQCMQAFAIIRLSIIGPCRRKRGLPSCADAQARTQSSQRVHRSISMTIDLVPLKKRCSAMNSIKLADGAGAFSIGWVSAGLDMLAGTGLDGKSVTDNFRF